MTAEAVKYFVKQRALFVINHSAGKDSQAMTAIVRALVPDELLVVVHAELPGVDWEGLEEHILETTQGLPFYKVRAQKTFFEMVTHRGKWPSSQQRQCTSDLKRDPINKQVRAIAKERGARFIISCMGLRAEESTGRAKQPVFKMDKRGSKAGRKWYTWLPIHDFKIGHIWQTIKDAGQEPHKAYAAGMSRLSCCFCIMACKKDLATAAALKPELFKQYVDTEKALGFSFIAPRKTKTNPDPAPVYLDEYLGIYF